MNWITFVENPKAISHLYDEVPPLQGTAVKKVSLDRNGPTVKFEMDLPRFADHVPVRWEKGSNTVHVELDFYWVSDLKLTGFSTNPNFDFSVEKRLDGILVSAGDKESQITFLCQNIYIRQVSGYINKPPGPPPVTIPGRQ